MAQVMNLLDDGLMNVQAAQRLSGLGRSGLYNLMANGDLCYVKIGRRRLIPRRALMDFMMANLRNGRSD